MQCLYSTVLKFCFNFIIKCYTIKIASIIIYYRIVGCYHGYKRLLVKKQQKNFHGLMVNTKNKVHAGINCECHVNVWIHGALCVKYYGC